VLIVDAKSGAAADPVMVDRATGRPLIGPDYVLVPGPAAADSTRRRLASGSRGSLMPGTHA
jgi:hypothetical protein